jgi:uncharacterized membrane protein YphA (DoxX/SURF4 family)
MKTILQILRLSLIALFTYASIVKLSDVGSFQQQLSQSPLIGNQLITWVSYGVPTSEIIIVILLAIDRLLEMGAFLSFLLMMFFTVYLSGLILFYDKVPCACGGILGQMSYPIHITFNSVFCLAALVLYIKNDTLVNEVKTNDHPDWNQAPSA